QRYPAAGQPTAKTPPPTTNTFQMSYILCCSDGSAYAHSVYHHSAWAAQRMGAGVRVLHMVEHSAQPAVVDTSGAIGLGAKSRLMKELVDIEEAQGKVALARAAAVLADARERLQESGTTDLCFEQRHGSI